MAKNKISLETYGEEPKAKEKFIKRASKKFKELWARTIFPDMIKNKKEEKEWKRKLRKQAAEQARAEIEKELVKKYKADMVAKATGQKKDRLSGFNKLAKAFEMGSLTSDDKISKMLGTGGSTDKTDALGKMGNTGIVSDDKISRMLGSSNTGSKTDVINKMGNTGIVGDDKISRILGGSPSQKKKGKQGRSAEDRIKDILS